MSFFEEPFYNLSEYPEYNIEKCQQDQFYKRFDDVILSCYFTLKVDPIHSGELTETNKRQPKDNFEYIKPLYQTCLNQKIHLIIFHDSLSADFINKYQTEQIIFRKTELSRTGFSINDERYCIYYKYLLDNPYQYVLTSDVSDVYINKNPFDFMRNYHDKSEYQKYQHLIEDISKCSDRKEIFRKARMYPELGIQDNFSPAEIMSIIYNLASGSDSHKRSEHKIFIGCNSIGNGPNIKSPQWYQRRQWKIKTFNSALKKNQIDPMGYTSNQYQIYNVGTTGGKYHDVMSFFSKFLKILYVCLKEREKNNYNMLLANYLIIKYLSEDYDPHTFCSKYVYTGFPFVSIYQRLEQVDVSPCCLIHK